MKINNVVILISMISVMSCNKAEDKIENAEVIPVKVFTLKNSSSNESIISTGLITTENETKLAFKVGGVIDRIYVKEGQSFNKGQLLATLKLTEIEAQVTQSKLGYEKSKRDYNRVYSLHKDSVATLEQLQNSKTLLDISEKALEQANFNKKYAYIYATSSGFVTKKIGNEGEIIQGGFPVLAINENNNQKNWIVKIGVSDSDWSAINENNSCKIKANGKSYSGIVSQKSKAVDSNSGTFQIEIKIQNATKELAVGMFANVTIHVSSNKNINAIPYDAVIEANGKKAFVFIPTSDTTVKKIPIEIESFNDKEVIVAKGLENASSIIIGNSPFLNEKSKIKIVK
ncbi:efflux RND transporter periplasmic adaptor subunit [Flavobacterium sp. UBA7663]|uniref:efflux RND transporter periplasmic adaptor subunit n=1 Tax=Flavobacterium sp. UBA7663 TaxID=1946557 RepID=UPI0025B982AC|nr:efflux RND transporter periplasmic adaptor subunit [Flavobacterium sp. UBA7663]